MHSRGPTIIKMNNGNAGIECCCFRCCTCININFIKSEAGVLKIAQLVMGSMCQSLAMNFGLPYASTMGAAYYGFLTTVTWCLMTTFLLVLCYTFSTNSYGLIKQSLFEFLFNAAATFSYLSSTSYLGFAVNTFLYPQYLITPYFQVYPAMTAAYMLGTVVGVIHGYDAYQAYRFYKGYR